MQPRGSPSGGQGSTVGPARLQPPDSWAGRGVSPPTVGLPVYQLVPTGVLQTGRQPAQQPWQPSMPQPSPLLQLAHTAAMPAWQAPALQQHWQPPSLQQHWQPPPFVGLPTPPALQQPWRPPAHADGPRMAPHPRPPLICGPLPRPWQPSPSPWLPPKQAGSAIPVCAPNSAARRASRAGELGTLPTGDPGPSAAASSGQLGPLPPPLLRPPQGGAEFVALPAGLPRSRSHSDLRGEAQPTWLAQHQALPKHHPISWRNSRACGAAAEPS